jgi:hypothetical protein
MTESITRWNKSEPFELQVSRGHVRGHRVIHVFGYNPDLDSGVEETVWTAGGIYQHLASPTTLTVSSDNTNDSSTGTGARTVRIEGINGTGAEHVENVTLNGQNAVNTAFQYTEINSVQVMTVGSGGKNAGAIYVGTGTVTAGVPATIIGHILAGDNNSQIGHYEIPKGFIGYLIKGYISSGTESSGYVTGRLKIRRPDNVIMTAATVTFSNGLVEFNFDYPVPLPENSCVFANAITNKNNEQVSSYFQIVLVAQCT